MFKQDKLPFNKWSQKRIKQGKKFCTSRTRLYNDPRREYWLLLPLWFVKKYLWQLEGADSPEEFEKIWKEIHSKKEFMPNQEVYVHFGDFRKES